MKKLFIILAIAATGCTVSKPAPQIRLTVSYLHREGGITEVQARRGYMWYAATCKDLPDSVKLGTILTADPTRKPDTCKCIFKRIK